MENNQKTQNPAPSLARKELPKHDFTQYLGRRTRIASANVLEGQHGPFVKVETDPLGYMDEKQEKPVTASRILGLARDENTGEMYIGVGTKTEQFLKEHGAEQFSDVIGKTVTVNGRKDKEGRMWLDFI